MVKWADNFQGSLLEYNHVHIWRVNLDYSESKLNLLKDHLSKEEIERANRFYFEKDRRQFMLRRGILKQIISKYLAIDPQNLPFEYNRFGKPYLITDSLKHDLKFNMSYSNNVALCCISPQKNVGIDIEYLHKDVEFQPIIDRFFSQNEKEFIENIVINKQKEGFFKIWTRKEAILKAMGKGMSFPLEMINVPFKKNNFTININSFGNQGNESSWYVQDLFPASNYVASIAIEGLDSEPLISHFTF